VRGQAPRVFRYRPLGMLASLGRRCAVAEILGVRFSGFVAWWLWRTIYLAKLPGVERKLRVVFDWTLDLFFARDIVYLRGMHAVGGAASADAHPPAR
jgi:NADH dehydrogenase